MKRVLATLAILVILAGTAGAYVPSGCYDVIEGDCRTPGCWTACISQILDGCVWDPSCY
jgi:hypothetical protein